MPRERGLAKEAVLQRLGATPLTRGVLCRFYDYDIRRKYKNRLQGGAFGDFSRLAV